MKDVFKIKFKIILKHFSRNKNFDSEETLLPSTV